MVKTKSNNSSAGGGSNSNSKDKEKDKENQEQEDAQCLYKGSSEIIVDRDISRSRPQVMQFST